MIRYSYRLLTDTRYLAISTLYLFIFLGLSFGAYYYVYVYPANILSRFDEYSESVLIVSESMTPQSELATVSNAVFFKELLSGEKQETGSFELSGRLSAPILHSLNTEVSNPENPFNLIYSLTCEKCIILTDETATKYELSLGDTLYKRLNFEVEEYKIAGIQPGVNNLIKPQRFNQTGYILVISNAEFEYNNYWSFCNSNDCFVFSTLVYNLEDNHQFYHSFINIIIIVMTTMSFSVSLVFYLFLYKERQKRLRRLGNIGAGNTLFVYKLIENSPYFLGTSILIIFFYQDFVFLVPSVVIFALSLIESMIHFNEQVRLWNGY